MINMKNNHTTLENYLGLKAGILNQAIRRPHRDRRVPQGDVILSF